jgi:peptide methionine sulfoxide reductase msrA/msrB
MLILSTVSCSQEKKMTYNKLTSEEEWVIIDKGTERPFTGKYEKFNEEGTYVCKRCNVPLYKSSSKFDAQCGWPAFDDEIKGAVKHTPDGDGMRTEITCNSCGAHLGHVFIGEGYTAKNTRHCVNSISLNFIPSKDETAETAKAIYAGGCFWGMEYYFKKANGVISTRVGYIGGHKDNPTYKEVCYTNTGHIEATEVTFNPKVISFDSLTKLFFELHDPTQVMRQGPDIGEQYKSAIFYLTDEQREISEKLINILKEKGYKVATELIPAKTFWEAEDYHQDYYNHKGGIPYCHSYVKRF